MSPTGGLFWHGRAWWRSSTLWRPFREQLAAWLAGWAPPRRRLLLVGPSAGWCLRDDFLARFEAIHAVDPDPASKPLFALRHGATSRRHGIKLRWSRGDFFAHPSAFLGSPEEEAVLFCNVAGQLRFVSGDLERLEAELSALKHGLAGRDWASFHELLSGAAPRIRRQSLPAVRFTTQVDPKRLLAAHDLGGEWLDHVTGGLLPDTGDRLVLPWRFSRDRIHFIEAGTVAAGAISPPS